MRTHIPCGSEIPCLIVEASMEEQRNVPVSQPSADAQSEQDRVGTGSVRSRKLHDLMRLLGRKASSICCAPSLWNIGVKTHLCHHRKDISRMFTQKCNRFHICAEPYVPKLKVWTIQSILDATQSSSTVDSCTLIDYIYQHATRAHTHSHKSHWASNDNWKDSKFDQFRTYICSYSLVGACLTPTQIKDSLYVWCSRLTNCSAPHVSPP